MITGLDTTTIAMPDCDGSMDDVALIKRLALIRHTYQTGVRQSESPSPYGAMSLLTFHDSLEWFLLTACDHFAVDPPASEKLLDYFDRLSQKSGAMVGKGALKKCVAARRELKHRLIVPDDSTVQEIRYSSGIFLTENSSHLFQLNFDEISLVDGIQTERIRNHVNDAIVFKVEKDYNSCVRELRKAYETVVDAYKLNLIPGWYHTCDINPYGILCFSRLAFIGGPYPRQQEIAFEQGCTFCCDFLVEAIIKIEQTMSRRDLLEFLTLLRELDKREAALRRS